MGKASNKRKSGPREPALVHVYSKGGVTVRAKRAFPPEVVPLVVHAFRHFINDRLEDGMALAASIQESGCDLFDFTLASSTNAQMGDADVFTWAWGASSGRSLQWLTRECFSDLRPFPHFFTILPIQLELTVQGSAQCVLGMEMIALLARHLDTFGAAAEFAEVWASIAPRACVIFKDVLAEHQAERERATLSEATAQGSEPIPSQKSGATRL